MFTPNTHLVEFGRTSPPLNDFSTVIYVCVHCGSVMNNIDRELMPNAFFTNNLRIDVTLQGYMKKMCNDCWKKKHCHHLLEIRPLSPQGHNHIAFISGKQPLLFCPCCQCLTSSFSFDFARLKCKCCVQSHLVDA